MNEKRHNYLWGLSPGNIITLGLILVATIGASFVAQYRIGHVEVQTDTMRKERLADKREQDAKLNIVQRDIAVIKAVVLRIERKR